MFSASFCNKKNFNDMRRTSSFIIPLRGENKEIKEKASLSGRPKIGILTKICPFNLYGFELYIQVVCSIFRM